MSDEENKENKAAKAVGELKEGCNSLLSVLLKNKLVLIALCVIVVLLFLVGIGIGSCSSKSSKGTKAKANAAVEEAVENWDGLSEEEIAARQAQAAQEAADKAASEANASVEAGFYSIISGQKIEKVAAENTPAANPIYDFRYKVCDMTTGLAAEYVGTSATVVFPKEKDGIPVVEVSMTQQRGDTADKTIVIPEGVKIIGKFQNIAITSIDIPTTVKVIRNSAFYGAKIKGDFVVHSSVMLGTGLFERAEIQRIVWPFGTVPESAFKDAVGLTNVTLSEAVKIIRRSAFEVSLNWGGTAANVRGAGVLESVTFPQAISEMGRRAFRGNMKLATVAGLDSCKKFVNDGNKEGADDTGNTGSTSDESYVYEGEQFEYCSALPIATENKLRSIGYTDTFSWHKDQAPQRQ